MGLRITYENKIHYGPRILIFIVINSFLTSIEVCFYIAYFQGATCQVSKIGLWKHEIHAGNSFGDMSVFVRAL